MNRSLNLRFALRTAGLRSLGLLGRAFVLATVASLCVGCGGATEPEPAGLPEGVTDFAPKVEPPKNAKPERGGSADPENSTPPSN